MIPRAYQLPFGAILMGCILALVFIAKVEWWP